MTAKDTIVMILISIVILLAIDKCNSNDSLKEESAVETKKIERENERKEEKRLSVIHDTLIQYRDRIKTKHEKVIEYVLVMDTVETDKSFDSLQLTKKATVVMAYELKACQDDKVVSDSINANLTARNTLLKRANANADTLLVLADKRAKKNYFKGFKAGFVTGAAIGTTSTIILSK